MDIELSGANPVGNNATDLQKQRNHYGHEGCEARFPKKKKITKLALKFLTGVF